MNNTISFTQKFSQNHEESYTSSAGDSVLTKGLKYATGTGLAAAALSESAISGVLSMITFPFQTSTSLKNRANASLNTAQTIMGQKLGVPPKKAAIAATILTAAAATAYFFGPSLLASKGIDLPKPILEPLDLPQNVRTSNNTMTLPSILSGNQGILKFLQYKRPLDNETVHNSIHTSNNTMTSPSILFGNQGLLKFLNFKRPLDNEYALTIYNPRNLSSLRK